MNKNTKITIVVIIVLLLLSIIVKVVFFTKEAYFNKIPLSELNYTLNKTESNYADTIVMVGLDVLRIENVVIYLRPISKGATNKDLQGYDLSARIISGANNQYLIEIKNMSRSNTINVLSHELIHLKQMYQGRYKPEKTHVLWNGRIIPLKNIPKYEDRPWEREAFKESTYLKKQIEKQLYKN